MYAVLVVLLATFCGSDAFQRAECSKTIPVETLDLKSLEGKWYELSSYGVSFRQPLIRCHMTTITAGSDGKSFVMDNDRVVKLINTHIKTKWTVEGKGDKITGDLTLKFKVPLIGTIAMPFKILGTDDYKNYIIFHACVFKSNLVFIFTRKMHYEPKELESLYSSIDETLKNNGLSRSQFTLLDQSNCEDKSTLPSKNDSAGSTETSSADASQTKESSAPTNGAVEEEFSKTEETAAPKTEEIADSKTEETELPKPRNLQPSRLN